MTNTMFLKYSLLVVFLSSLVACGSEVVFSPKPRAYPRVEYPIQKSIQKFDPNYCSFTFDYPDYAKIIQDEAFFGEKPEHPCWFDIDIPSLNAKIHCSYTPIDKAANSFEKLNNDAFVLANKHNIKADYIDQLPVQKQNGVSGYVFDIQGDVASPFQFYLTDSTSHFMRGSLYVNAKAKRDSLEPVYEFIKKDIMLLINTFEWTTTKNELD